MLGKYDAVRYELLRPEQVKAIRAACPIAYVPAGTLEWHGFQNPLGCDALKAHGICCEAALRHGGAVLPPFYQGVMDEWNWGPEGWDGYTLAHNTQAMFDQAMLGIGRALVSAGWKVLVGVTGHDVNHQRDGMARAIQAATDGQDARGFAMMEGELHAPDARIPFQMDHAAAWETSCMMYLCPDKVDLDTLRTRTLSADEDFVMSGPEGMGGKNPLKHASAEMGRRIVQTMGDLIGAKAKAMLAAR